MKLSTIYRLVMKAPRGTLSFYQLMRPLKKAFKPYHWIRFEQQALPLNDLHRKYSLTNECALCVTGRFEPNYNECPLCIVTVTNFSPLPKSRIRFEGQMRSDVLFDIFATIVHERVHLLQDRKAKGCPRPYIVRHADPVIQRNLQYYGSKDEIDAYGFTAALEEHYSLRSDVIDRYRETFGVSDPRYKRFLKKKWKYGLTLPPIDAINRPAGGRHGRECRTRGV